MIAQIPDDVQVFRTLRQTVPNDADAPTEYEPPYDGAYDPEDLQWAAETNPYDAPEANERWATLLGLDAEKADRIYRTMPNFEEWDTHCLVAWLYAIDWELRERLA